MITSRCESVGQSRHTITSDDNGLSDGLVTVEELNRASARIGSDVAESSAATFCLAVAGAASEVEVVTSDGAGSDTVTVWADASTA